MVRDYKAEDFDSIWAINTSSFPNYEPKWFIQDAIKIGKTWVYEIDGKVVGFLIGKLKYDMPYVHNVAVSKESRNKGVATALFSKFEEYYTATQKPENKSLWLQVNYNNPAQKLYFDLGYRTGFVDENYYGNGQHALCMYKSTRPFQNMGK